MTRTEREPRLDRLEVSLTGRLSSMSHAEAKSRITLAGGKLVDVPSETTDVLVVGQDGPPLGDDGRPTKALLKARELRADGAKLRILQEDEWLALLGLEERQTDLHRRYTPAQVAQILGVPASRVRAWVRHGLVQPAHRVGRLSFFDFSQVSSLRTIARLLDAGISASDVGRSLRQLDLWCGDTSHALAGLEALDTDGGLVMRLEDGSVVEPSGQLVLDYDAEEIEPEQSTPIRSLFGPSAGSAEWFDAGIRAEERGRLEEAAAAYERALEIGGPQAEALFNLGNALSQLGHREEAIARLRQATTLEPDYVEAWNNLGNALSEEGHTDDAIHAYRRALAIAPSYADAHFNLGEALFARGDGRGARKHWQAYLEEDPTSEWAARVRERLARVDGLEPTPPNS